MNRLIEINRLITICTKKTFFSILLNDTIITLSTDQSTKRKLLDNSGYLINEYSNAENRVYRSRQWFIQEIHTNPRQISIYETISGEMFVFTCDTIESKLKLSQVERQKNEIISKIDSVYEMPKEIPNDEDTLCKQPDIMPIPEGGIVRLYKFIGSNMRFPVEAISSGCTGKVIVSFVVEKDGTMSNVKVDKGVPGCEDLNNEAVRIIKSYPYKWVPGKKEGKLVRVGYTIPISFRTH